MNKKLIAIFITSLFLFAGIQSVSSMELELKNKDFKTSEIQNTFFSDSLNDFENEKLDEIYIPGTLYVKFKDSVNLQPSKTPAGKPITNLNSINALISNNNIEDITQTSLAEKSVFKNLFKFSIDEDEDHDSILAEFESDPNVEYVDLNYLYKTCQMPTDPMFDQQWALHNTGQDGGIIDADVNALEAWDHLGGFGSEDITVAIVDSGVDYTHPDLSDNIWINSEEIANNGIDDDGNGYVDDVTGYDFVNIENLDDYKNSLFIEICPDEDYLDKDNDPMDTHGHGTHCAGIVAATPNNGIGVAGIAGNSKVMALRAGFKMIYMGEESGFIDIYSAAEAIQYATDKGVDIVSMSFGSFQQSDVLKNAIEDAYSQGVVFVAAAGNENDYSSHYPSSYNHVISVAATDRNDEKAYFSNYGDYVDVAAPGVDILSTVPGGNYEEHSGTSMSCPLVAGILALLIAKHPDYSQNVLKVCLKQNAYCMHPLDDIVAGRVNAKDSMLYGIDYAKSAFAQYFHQFIYEFDEPFEIEGSAYGNNFDFYTIEFGKGRHPTSWNTLIQSEQEFSDGVLASFNPANYQDGIYTFKLTVKCGSNFYLDSMRILINNEINEFIVDKASNPDCSLRETIYDAGDGDTVRIKAGIYNYDLLKITKEISIIGDSKENTILEGLGYKSYYLLGLFHSGIEIKKLCFRNCFYAIRANGLIMGRSSSEHIISDIKITDAMYAMLFMHSNRNKISYCQMSDLSRTGIKLMSHSQNNEIFNNQITDIESDSNTLIFYDSVGIYLEYSYGNMIYDNFIASCECEGIFLYKSENNYIAGNNIVNIRGTVNGVPFTDAVGIGLSDNSNENWIRENTIKSCDIAIETNELDDECQIIDENEIKHNEIKDCRLGITLFKGSQNKIIGNNFTGNNKALIVKSGRSNNVIWYNNFTDNKINAFAEGQNSWDDGSKGNYWDDYTGEDKDEDGIGDTPYEIRVTDLGNGGPDGLNIDHCPTGSFDDEVSREINQPLIVRFLDLFVNLFPKLTILIKNLI